MNLPSDDPILDTAAGEQPASSNDPAAVFNSTLKMNGYLGGNVDLDFYFTRTGTDTWEVAVYDASTATAGGFPYGEPALEVGTLTFDTATGDLTGGGALSVPLPSGDSLPVDLSGTHSIPDFTAGPDEGAQFSFDLPASDPTVEPYLAGTTPAANQPSSTYSHKTSLVAYDNVGNEVLLDVYYAKGPDNSWEISVFDQADATDGGFPYGAAGSQPLASELLEFDPNGQIVGDARLTLQVPVGKELTLDLSESTQLSADFTVQEADVNGDGASKATGYSISAEGIVYAEFENGSYRPLYQIALADVPSPDFLEPASGNVFQQTAQSGDARLGVAGSSGFGTVRSGALENSTVDIAKELTTMIEAQRTYTANSKSFQTSSELLEVLVNLKR